MIYSLILVISAIIVWVISTQSGLLRNKVFSQANFLKIAATDNITDPQPGFSLGHSQFAFWTVIIASSVIYTIFNGTLTDPKTHDFDPVNLILLGITAGTTVLAKVIDGSQSDNQADGASQQDFPSKGFFTDIISDENGVSIHRLQNVIWTITVGVIYIGFVFAHDKLPDGNTITPHLLELMGISTGAYLGLKINEGSVPVPEPAPVINADTVVADMSNSAAFDR